MHPLKLIPVAKTAIWGGQRLKNEWKKPSSLPVVAETWELTVRPLENNTIAEGEEKGRSLADILAVWGPQALGSRCPDAPFPLLIKFIDADDRLSVQVHPDDAFAASTADGQGKTEMWYIVDAQEGASILYGLKENTTEADFAAAVAAGDPMAVLNRVEVKKGDCFFIPAGMPHAIGKGILVAEIQQNCDLTYRVYDYDRRDKAGNLRELHIEKALQVTKPFTADEVEAIRYAKGKGVGCLAHCAYFAVYRADINGSHMGKVTTESFCHLLFLAGEGEVETEDGTLSYTKGDSILLPADTGAYRIVGTGEVLITTL